MKGQVSLRLSMDFGGNETDSMATTATHRRQPVHNPFAARGGKKVGTNYRKVGNTAPQYNPTTRGGGVGGGGGGGQPGQQLSRGQKKRLAKREKYFKRERMILQSLKLARQEEQKGKIDGFDSLRDALIETTTTTTATRLQQQEQQQSSGPMQSSSSSIVVGNSNKAKRKLVADEVEHLDLVLNHPQFNASPFETIGEHLQNSLADDRRRQELKSRQRTDDEKKLQKQKVEKKKELLDGYKKKSKTKKYKPRRTN
mmetsp:Transcript_47619/g.116004  ORF Transcript_47619/g.116004 Transcript_47619/m.116004 type:complete len:255 (-) Transcript_47619:45-809(-)